MGFDTADGTHGARRPKGRLLQWGNRVVARVLRRTGGRVMGIDMLVLTTVGRRTGEERRSPLSSFPGPDGTWLIVASANGAAANPAWYHNLAAHPDRVRAEVGGRSTPVVATQLTGGERAQAWRDIVAAGPRFAQYQRRTDRELPVIRLTPVSAPAPSPSPGESSAP